MRGFDQREANAERRVRTLLAAAAVTCFIGAASSLAIPYMFGTGFFVAACALVLLVLQASKKQLEPTPLDWATVGCLVSTLPILVDYVMRAESVDVDTYAKEDWLEMQVWARAP